MAPGFYGKHPDFGDFLSASLPASAEAVLLPWLAQGLALMREQTGDDWHAAFDAAPPVRFWIGATVAGGGLALRGVLIASRDKVGRRYPMILTAQTASAADPASDQTQTFYDTAIARLLAARKNGLVSAREFAATLAGEPILAADSPDIPATAPPDRWWASNPALPPDALWAELAATEHCAAAAARSYWWVAADAVITPDEGAMATGHDGLALACPGLPDPAALIWLLTAAPRRTAPPALKATQTGDASPPVAAVSDPLRSETIPPPADSAATAAPEETASPPLSSDGAPPPVDPVPSESTKGDTPPMDAPPADLAMAGRIAALALAASADGAGKAHDEPPPADDQAAAIDTAGDRSAFSLSLIEFGQALGRADDRPAHTETSTAATDDDGEGDCWLLPETAADDMTTANPAPAPNRED